VAEAGVSTAPARVALSAAQVVTLLASLEGWNLYGDGDNVAIEKTFHFVNYLRTMAFVNALAYLAEQNDHHPELLVQYKSCSVRFSTHDVKGISASDFACANLVDALYQPPAHFT
jgi:4a-hydroxytetrahydrobiopterin dehydratase